MTVMMNLSDNSQKHRIQIEHKSHENHENNISEIMYHLLYSNTTIGVNNINSFTSHLSKFVLPTFVFFSVSTSQRQTMLPGLGSTKYPSRSGFTSWQHVEGAFPLRGAFGIPKHHAAWYIDVSCYYISQFSGFFFGKQLCIKR